jgi:rSAM/selenodomain-associated transferase 2
MKPGRISIIMPVYNEENYLGETLSRLSLGEKEELIVVDGGSTDRTLDIARKYTDKVFQTKTGRANVMNHGAAFAGGDILLFLHADCNLPSHAFDIIRSTLADDGIAAGGFYLGIDHPSPAFRIIETAANLRHRLTSLIYGDQAMFLRKSTFDKAGGFANIPIMEDIEMSRKLKRLGRIVFVKPAVRVSPRRWLNEGIVYTTLRDWTISFSYTFLKVSPYKLIHYYKEIR